MCNKYNNKDRSGAERPTVRFSLLRMVGAAIVPVVALGPFLFQKAESHPGLLTKSLAFAATEWTDPADDSLRTADSLRIEDSLAIADLNRAELRSSSQAAEEKREDESVVEIAAAELATGQASYYGNELAGRRTASGERFDPEELTAAHRTLPFGTRVRVTNLKNGKSVVVRINDRGPFTRRRIIDISHAAAQKIGMVRSGIARVRVDMLEGR